MKVLVTGNQGYIGLVLTEMLRDKGYEVVGYDTDYYRGCELVKIKRPREQIRKDIRDVSREDLEGIDGVIHLAALSNDPLGKLKPALTEDINFNGTLRLAARAKKSGVKRFIYASSQSMYGISGTDEELKEDESEKRPLTFYARTKWEAECELRRISSGGFAVVCFRPSTVFGVSPRFRCDIVFNNLVACAYTTGKIEIKSDGTPWRPVVHIRDVSAAFIAGLEAPAEIVAGEAFNVGIKDGNFTIRDLAEAAQKAVPGSSVVFTGEHGPDSRTYRVSFAKILDRLGGYYKPEWGLLRGGKEMVEFFKKIKFSEEEFRGRRCVRVEQIKYLLEKEELDRGLRWISKA